MKRVHKDGTLDYQLYKANDGAIYFNYHNSTVDTFRCDEYSLDKINKKRMPDEDIIGEKCKCYEIEATSKQGGDKVILDACYPKNKRKYHLDYKLYKTYRDYFIYELFKQNKVPYFKYFIHFTYVSIQYMGTKITKND
jgi:hypothetical protein